MGKYSLRIKDICENLYVGNDSKLESFVANLWGGGFEQNIENPFDDFVPVDKIIEQVRSKIFDFDYPTVDDEQKKNLETKILKHYYMYEIGSETYGRFKLALNDKLNMIMPYYNKLYESQTLISKDKLLANKDYQETRNTTGSGQSKVTSNGTQNSTGTGTSKVDSTAKQKFEDTPTSALGNDDYATNITTNTNDSTTTNNTTDTTTNSATNESNGSSTEEMLRHIWGNDNFLLQDALAKYRDNILNIDESIITELYDLFMLIY